MKLNDKDLTKVVGGASYDNKKFSFTKGEKILSSPEKTSYYLIGNDYINVYKDKKISCKEIRVSDEAIIDNNPFITANVLYYMYTEYGHYNS